MTAGTHRRAGARGPPTARRRRRWRGAGSPGRNHSARALVGGRAFAGPRLWRKGSYSAHFSTSMPVRRRRTRAAAAREATHFPSVTRAAATRSSRPSGALQPTSPAQHPVRGSASARPQRRGDAVLLRPSTPGRPPARSRLNPSRSRAGSGSSRGPGAVGGEVLAAGLAHDDGRRDGPRAARRGGRAGSLAWAASWRSTSARRDSRWARLARVTCSAAERAAWMRTRVARRLAAAERIAARRGRGRAGRGRRPCCRRSSPARRLGLPGGRPSARSAPAAGSRGPGARGRRGNRARSRRSERLAEVTTTVVTSACGAL